MSIEKSLELDVILEQIKRYCAFSLGIKRIEECKPSFDKLVIQRDNAYLREALASIVHVGTMPFSGITDIGSILERARRQGVLNGQMLVDEMRFIRGVKGIVAYGKEISEVEHPNLEDLIGSLAVHERCERFIAARINDYGEVMDQASPALAKVRAQLRRVDAEINEAAMRFVNSHKDSVVDSIVTYRAGRAVILVKASEKNSFGGLVYGDSGSGAASYVEPASLINVNNKKQQLINQEHEEIQKVLEECSEEVSKVAKEELANLQTCAILDEIFAKAQWGWAHEAYAAELSEEKQLHIEYGRHPLIDEKKVVSNSYHIVPPVSTLLITGPNTGGKTVSMKIIGLFVLMTYAGMPVTAERAVIPYFDKVFADIGDDQSVVESLSSFSAHIKKQAEICNCATGNSLVLLDEVGSGTDPREGESLAIAILNELRQRGTMTVATTHYGRLKSYGKRHEDILIASVQFDMEKLEPTYRFVEGLSGQSNAFAVAERYGLPKRIVKYAGFLKEQAKTQEDELIEKLDRQLNEAAKEREALQAELKANRELNQQLQKEKNAFERERDEWRAKAEKEAEAYVEKARREADEILAEMRESSMQSKYHEVLNIRNKLKESEKEAEQPERVEGEFRVGDAVELRSSNQVCEVVEVGKREITVEFNGRKIRVKKNQIRHSNHVIVRQKPQATVSIGSGSIFSSMPIECNLIGMRVDEAMGKMTSYVDQAKVRGLKTFRIIHGDGSGALRSAVHQALKKDKAVKEFRLGLANEGGSGATVVTLN